MKKGIGIFLAFTMLVLLCACAGKENTSGTVSSADVSQEFSSSEAGENSSLSATSPAQDALIADLEEEIEQLEERLTDEKQNSAALRVQIDDLESEIEKYGSIQVLRAIPVAGEHFYTPHMLYMTLQKNSKGSYDYVLTLRFDDGETTEVIRNFVTNGGYIDPSPSGRKIVINNFSLESTTTVYLYDVKSRKKRELSISLPLNYTVSAMKWLDDRYILFVSQFDHGTIVRGGDVYYYDTETDTYGKIIGTDTGRLQVNAFDRYEDFMLITAALYEETYNFAEDQHYIITFTELYDLIENGKELVFEAENGM